MADPVSPITPQMQTLITQLLQSQADRSARTTPIHQAAMAMAQRMAPGYAQGAMGTPSAPPPGGGGSLTVPSTSGGGIGPGIGTTAAAAVFAALLKNPGFMAWLKSLGGSGAVDPTFGGTIQGNKPQPGGTGFPDVPVTGGAKPGMGNTFPGYFTNPDGSTVEIPGDPANGGGYGGGVFPVTSNTTVGGGQYGPFHD